MVVSDGGYFLAFQFFYSSFLILECKQWKYKWAYWITALKLESKFSDQAHVLSANKLSVNIKTFLLKQCQLLAAIFHFLVIISSYFCAERTSDWSEWIRCEKKSSQKWPYGRLVFFHFGSFLTVDLPEYCFYRGINEATGIRAIKQFMS